MSTRHPFRILAVAAVCMGVALPASAQTGNADYDNLIGMLANAPDTTRVRGAQIIADYVDYRALESVAGAPQPASVDDLGALGDREFDAWAEAQSRVEFDPLSVANAIPGEALARAVPTASSAFRQLPEVMGVDWLEIDRALAIGGSPARAILLGGGAGLTDLGSIAPALEGRGFEIEQLGRTLVWHRFNDREIRTDAIESGSALGNRIGDPFGIQQGHAARIAVLPGVLAGSREWSMIDQVAGAAGGTVRSLADDGEIRAAAAAITDASRYEGTLVRALFTRREFTAFSVSRNKLGPTADDAQRAAFAEVLQGRLPGELPPYRLAVMADRQDGDDEIAIVALVYNSPEEAQAAASAVQSRVAAYVPLTRKIALGEAFNLGVFSHVFEAVPGGRSVAVVSITGSGREDRPGQLFRTLQTGFFFLEPEFLIVSSE